MPVIAVLAIFVYLPAAFARSSSLTAFQSVGGGEMGTRGCPSTTAPTGEGSHGVATTCNCGAPSGCTGGASAGGRAFGRGWRFGWRGSLLARRPGWGGTSDRQ